MNSIKNIQTFILVTFALVFSLKTSAQAIDLVDNKGTIHIVNNNNVYTDDNRPTVAVENDVWFDTDPTIPTVIRIHNGGTANDLTDWNILEPQKQIINPTTSIDLSDPLLFEETHYTVIIESTIDITLPVPGAANCDCKGREYILKNQTNTAINLLTTGFVDLEGNTQTSIPANTAYTLQNDGTNWQQISPDSGGAAHTGTTGSIFFADTAINGGVPTEDNLTLFWDDVNDFLGIGTNTPDTYLDIIAPGATNDRGVLKITSNDPDIVLNDTDGGTNTITYKTGGNNRALVGTTATDDNFFISIIDRNTNGIYDNAFTINNLTRNVGMGVDEANSTLQVDGSISKSIDETIAAGYNLGTNNSYSLLITDSSHTVILPTIAAAPDDYLGREYVIKNPTNTAVSIIGSPGSYIDNANTTQTTIPANSVLKLQSDGTNWQQMSPDGDVTENIYNTDGTLTAERTMTMPYDLILRSSANNKSTLTITRDANTKYSGIGFRNQGANYTAAISMPNDNSNTLDFYSGGSGSDINTIDKTLSLLNDSQIEFSQYGVGTFENTPTYFLGALGDGKVVEVDFDEVVLSGTQGSIFFADITANDGVATEDNDQLYWNDDTNALFVGNVLDKFETSPDKLNVSGAIRVTQGVKANNGTEATPSYRFNSDADTGMYQGTTVDNLNFTTGGSNAININPDQEVTVNNLPDAGTETVDIVVANAAGTLKRGDLSSLMPVIYAAGRHTESDTSGSVATYESTLTRNAQGDYSVVFDTDIGSSNYIIQLTPENCPLSLCPNGQPNVEYTNLSSTGFDIEAGDGGNGAGSMFLEDIGFMFTVIRLPDSFTGTSGGGGSTTVATPTGNPATIDNISNYQDNFTFQLQFDIPNTTIANNWEILISGVDYPTLPTSFNNANIYGGTNSSIDNTEYVITTHDNLDGTYNHLITVSQDITAGNNEIQFGGNASSPSGNTCSSGSCISFYIID